MFTKYTRLTNVEAHINFNVKPALRDIAIWEKNLSLS